MAYSLHAEVPGLAEFNQFFKTGQYTKAIIALEKLNPKENLLGEKYYLMGLCQSKLQEYDKAIKSFEAAIKEKNANVDLFYEYGQALYAANELKAARKAFKESINKKFNTAASQYYVAYISQMIEEYPEAKESYVDLIKNKDADVKIRQVARFQLAETMLLMMRDMIKEKDAQEKNVEKYIIPMMKEAYNTDKSTQTANDINNRIQEIEKEFNLDPNLLSNGKRVSPKRYSGYVSQKIKFDDNISLTNEENNVQQSKKESFIFESEAYGKYDFVLKKKFIISPEVRVNFIHHSDQDSPDVYQNNAYSINTNLKNKYEHTMNAQPASFLFDVEYSRNFKDWKKQHDRIPYTHSLNVGIGELFNFFRYGDTSIKIKRKALSGENEAISNNTVSVSADQTFALPTQHMLIALLEADYIDNFNNSSTNTNTYLLRLDYLIPDIMPKYTLGLAMATTLTDTKEQKDTRGTELSLNPSVDLSKEINEKMKISVNYDYTKSKSKQSDYAYQKSVFSTEFRYSF
jgi:tetratricopeptide (TPR) repeat protein